jgi:hypothetical protein
MVDEFLKCYQSNTSLREYNIVASLSIGREGECGEYPSEPNLYYLGLDSVGFDKQFENSYIYNNISLRDLAYMFMYAFLEDNYTYVFPCGGFSIKVKSLSSYYGYEIHIAIPLKVFMTKCMASFVYRDVSVVIDSIFSMYRDVDIKEIKGVQREV